MKIRLYAAIAGASLAVFLAGSAFAKDGVRDSLSRHARHVHAHIAWRHDTRRGQLDREYAQSFYDYRSASSVREVFMGMPPDGRFGRHGGRRERRYGAAVENLQGDFDGGVGYGTDGAMSFTDGYGQVHFYTGDFARHPGFGQGRRFGPRPGFSFRQGSPRGR